MRNSRKRVRRKRKRLRARTDAEGRTEAEARTEAEGCAEFIAELVSPPIDREKAPHSIIHDPVRDEARLSQRTIVGC